MIKSIKYTVFNLLAFILLVGCSTEKSLQTYFVDHQETADFISADIPTTVVSLDEAALTKDQKEAYNSVERLNFLGFKINETNTATYTTELSKVKALLNNVDYHELMEVNDSGNTFIIKYLGDDDSAEEVIVFASSKEMGFGIVRILGNNMQPNQMATLVDAVQKADFDESKLQGITDFFK